MKKTFNIALYTLAGYVALGSAVPAVHAESVQPPSAASVQVQASAAAAESQPVQVTAKTVKEETDQVTIDLSLPVIQGLKDQRYQSELNSSIESQAMKEAENLKKQAAEDEEQAKQSGYPFRPFGITVKYEVKAEGGAADNGIFSLKVVTYTYTGGAHGISRADTYTLRNEPQAKSLTLKDLFGPDYQAAVNKQIQAKIDENPEDYFKDAFQGVSETTPFYIEKGDAVVVFQPYEIAPYAAGMPEFRIPLPPTGTDGGSKEQAAVPTLNGKPLDAVDAAVYEESGINRMVPLREAAEELGYEVKWNAELQAAELNKGAQWTSLRAGKNVYSYNRMAPISLSAAPVIKENGKMYVPLSFFSEILKAEVKTSSAAITIK